MRGGESREDDLPLLPHKIVNTKAQRAAEEHGEVRLKPSAAASEYFASLRERQQRPPAQVLPDQHALLPDPVDNKRQHIRFIPESQSWQQKEIVAGKVRKTLPKRGKLRLADDISVRYAGT